ncbi:MAG: nucleotidyl transferase AbiEii/AbiGii toxin family protein [Proteobacteria bacterium]|nr:nucleotidyl transferase AbiEii/AbiGii toxin family protein [Pseudomonadota bacterium]
MKDYFDLWILLRDQRIDRRLVAKAIRATFERRQTKIPVNAPLGLSIEFASDALKTSQWNAFVARNNLDTPELGHVLDVLRERVDGFLPSKEDQR